jgi:hypothetical protein
MIGLLIEAGAKVATCGRQHDKLYALQLEYSQFMLHTMVCDVSHEEECKRFIQSTVETFGTIDILINNAGISMRSLFDDADTDVIRRMLDVNFMGVVYCTKAALHFIIEQRHYCGISRCRLSGTTGKRLFRIKFACRAGWNPQNRTCRAGSTCYVGIPGLYHIQHPPCGTGQSWKVSEALDESKLMSAKPARNNLHAIEKGKGFRYLHSLEVRGFLK